MNDAEIKPPPVDDRAFSEKWYSYDVEKRQTGEDNHMPGFDLLQLLAH